MSEFSVRTQKSAQSNPDLASGSVYSTPPLVRYVTEKEKERGGNRLNQNHLKLKAFKPHAHEVGGCDPAGRAPAWVLARVFAAGRCARCSGAS